MNCEGTAALFSPLQLLNCTWLRRLSNKEIFQQPRTVLPAKDSLFRHPQVGIVMFYPIILVHLAERQGVDWCCTFRLMCENLAN